MTPEDKRKLQQHIRSISEILVQNTPSEQLKDFESIELAIRDHLLKEINPEIASFFFKQQQKQQQSRSRKVASIIGQVEVTEKQAEKLKLIKNTRLSPFLQKCCLLLVANESFKSAQQDIEMLTGIKVSSSTQHRLVEKYEFKEELANKKIETLSIDGGKVRVRTPLGESSQWKDYKACSLHGEICMAFFQNNSALVNWTNNQPKTRIITCLGDGHDGVWNLITQIGEDYERREVLDWYHLVENLYKIGGSIKRIKRVENHLWSGEIEVALDEFKTSKRPSVLNFKRYINKHQARIPDYLSVSRIRNMYRFRKCRVND